jgi:hypothetical protein
MGGWYHTLGHDVPEELIEPYANAYRKVASRCALELGSIFL